ncbi:MAG: DUF2341 domain-containing protein [Patescibacteria group bacterium]
MFGIKKVSVLTALVVTSFAGYAVFAQFSESQIVVSSVNVFPESIESVGWVNADTVTFQNLDQYALSQEFNEINSAYLSTGDQTLRELRDEFENEEVMLVEEPVISLGSATSSATTTTEVSTTTEVVATSTPDVPAEPEVKNGTTTVEVVATTTEPTISEADEVTPEVPDVVESDSAATTSSNELDAEEAASTTTVLQTVDSLFSFAFGAVTRVFGFTTAATTTETVVSSEDIETDTEEIVSESEAAASTTTVTEILPTETLSAQENLVEEVPEEEEVATTTSSENEFTDEVEELLGEVVIDEVPSSATTSETVDDSSLATSTSDCVENCSLHTLTLSGFAMPIFEDGLELTGAQFRLSFAGAPKETRDEVTSLELRYSFDGGESWVENGQILLDEEQSNGINGGYYLFALPTIEDPAVLKDLTFQLRFTNNPEHVEYLFVESAWLELFTLENTGEPIDIATLLEDDGFNPDPLVGDVLVLPDGREITFDNTDENSDETLIIKSDELTYNGLTEITTYFNVTNTSNNTDTFSLQTYFPHAKGEVVSLEEWNQNKPTQVTIPEYRPFVYHCADGWEYSGEPISDSLFDMSRAFTPEALVDPLEADETEATTSAESVVLPEATATSSEPSEGSQATSTEAASLDTESASTTATTTTSQLLTDARLFTQATALATGTSEQATTTEAIETPQTYVCRNTNIVRACNSIDGDNTACHVDNVKVREHEVVKYAGGWQAATYAVGTLPEPGFIEQVGEFFGFGPDRKFVPNSFRVDGHTPDTFAIRPGETKYFKMEVSFPAFSSGEYWIEAVGGSEYGLLDPFWSSQWQYRIPIQIDNTNSTETLTEQQIFFEIDSALGDFWTNVADDGSDIRFIQERVENNLFPENGPVVENNYNLNWEGRVAINIASTSVTETLVDFPVYVDLSTLGDDFWSGVTNDGRDIRVTRSDGATEVPTDLVWIDTGSDQGELHFRAPVLNTADDSTFHLYFDNPDATAYASTSEFGSQNVWTNNYAAVYHFQDQGQPGQNNIGEYLDSTSNGFNAEDDTSATGTTGRLGDGVEFDIATTSGVDLVDHINIPVAVADSKLEMTYSVWYQTSNSLSSLDHTLLSGFNTSQNNEWIAWIENATQMEQFIDNSQENGNQVLLSNIGDGAWRQYVYTRSSDEFDDETRQYVDGALLYADTNIDNADQTFDINGLNIGSEQDTNVEQNNGGNQLLDGFVDEARFADGVRTDGWIAAEYTTQANPTSFYSTSTDLIAVPAGGDVWYSTSWNQRQLFTISRDNVDADITNFPVYLDLGTLGSTFFSGVASDGRDIRITTRAGVELPREVVRVDTGSGLGEVHFKTDLSSTEDNEFYIYFDNPDALAYADDDVYGAHNVWTNNFIAVYHFDQDAAGVGNDEVYLDSTSNEYHGDDENSSDDTTGIVGRGLELGDSSGDHIDLPDEALTGVTDIAVSGFYKVPVAAATDERTILSAANVVEDDEFRVALEFDGSGDDEIFFVHSANNESTGYDNGQNWGDDQWDHFLLSGDDSEDTVAFYLNGVPDGENGNGTQDEVPIDAILVANGGLVIGQEQTTVGSFDTSNQFIGLMDELRIASTTRDDNWADLEYETLANPTTFISTSTAETLQEVDFVELDYWIQHFSSSTQEADIWVQVDEIPAGGTALIWLYYGASGVTSTSNEVDTFTYSRLTELFYIVDDDVSSVSIQSLIDNNQVSFDGLATTTLNQGESISTTTVDENTIIRALGPISGTVSGQTGNTQDSTDSIAPISFATTTHAIGTNRAVNDWYAFSPFGSTTVRVFEAASASAGATFNVATSSAGTANLDITDSGQGVDGAGAIITSTLPAVVTHKNSTPGDGIVSYPPTTRDLFGVYTQNIHLSAVQGTTVDVFCSDGSSATGIAVSRGDHEAEVTCDTGADSEGAGPAARYTGSTVPVTALQQADADGNESTMFWPQMEFGTRYAMTNDAAYVAVVCSPRFGSVSLEIQDSTGGFIESATCSPNTTDPGKVLFNGGTDGDTLNYPAGYQVVSTNGVPFYAIYEDRSIQNSGTNVGDEKNLVGTVQARKFGADAFTIAFGQQEMANDADYEQLSFLWYQNGNTETPTSTWPISDSNVTEGESITGSGALQDGDVIRLRMNIEASTATGTENSAAFRLEYGAATAADQCSLIAESNWFEVGQPGSTTAAFSGFDIPLIQDGRILSSTTLASSTVFGTYEERNLSNLIQNEIGVGQVAEFDWVLQATNVDININYCFRMTRSGGAPLTTYTLYPQLETVGPPNVPTLLAFFDNERTATRTPMLEFVSSDIAGDDIDYQVQVANTVDFASPLIDRNSDDNFLEFENINNNGDKAPFSSGNQVRFTSGTSLATGTTYWWRVRADDPNGSATTSEWSSPYSFTVEDLIEVTEWYQTTGDQFSTNELSNMSTSSGEVALASSPATMTSTAIDFDDATFGNAWGEVSWSDTVTSGTSSVQVQFNDSGTWTLIPDSQIPNNSIGATSSPISISELDTSVYNEIRLVATFEGTTVSLQEWSVKWGLRVNTPTLGDSFDNEKFAGLSPVFDFTTTDPQGDNLEYELSISTDIDFLTSSSTFNSSTSPGFSAGNPYASGATVTYTTQTPLTNNTTYWWRVRAKDPNGNDSFSPWSEPDSFTASTSVSVSTWFQTTQEQFDQGELAGVIASSSDSVEITDVVGEFGTISLTNNNWTTVNTQNIYNDMVVVSTPEFDFQAGGQASGRTVRVRNKTSNSFEIKVDNYQNNFTGSTDVDYVVAETGDWTIDDGGSGFRLLAGTQESVSATQVDGYSNTVGEVITFTPAFSGIPVPITTVSTNNDSEWVSSHVDGGGTFQTEVTSSQMRVALALSRHTTSGRSGSEDIDYIVLDATTSTDVGGSVFQSLNSPDGDVDDGGAQVSISGFSTTPAITLIQNNAEDGGQGGFAQKDLGGTSNASNIFVSISEQGSLADGHTQEIVSIVAFENTAGNLTRLNAGDLTGTIAGEDIIFTDGAGPKFDNFSWVDSTPATSDILYQLQYQVSDGVYALIPDSAIPGNSTGTTTSPIDLTNVDINTYGIIRPFATLSCGGGSCPSIDNWQLEWSEGVNMSGIVYEYDRVTPVTSGTIMAAVNNGPALLNTGTIAGDGTWTLANVTAFAGDIITVWVDGAADPDEAVAVFEYDGVGDITGVTLYEQHLSLQADEDSTVFNNNLAAYDNSISGNEDIFFDVDLSGNLNVCAVGSCGNANLYIGPRTTYTASSSQTVSVTTHDFVNDGIVELDGNTFTVSGSWENNATSSTDTSTINLVATSSSETIISTESPLDFHNLSMGAGAGTATYTIATALDLSGSLTVASGTFDRGVNDISLQGNLSTGANATWLGVATTTFDGNAAATWNDDHVSSTTLQNIGNVVIDGVSKFVALTSDVKAYDITIGANDTLSGATYAFYVGGDWTNTGTFLAGSSNVEFIPDDRSYPAAIPGSADWYADISFASRLPIVVQDSEVSGALTNFPTFVDLSTLGSDFWGSVQTDGDDIRITTNDGMTELPYDLVEFDASAETGELHFLADAISSSATTTFYIYFDNPAADGYLATDTYGSYAVWRDYEAVYHFNDDFSTVGTIIPDDSGRGRDLLLLGGAMATTSGQVGVALNASGSAGYLIDTDFSWTSGDRLTTSGWYFLDDFDNETVWEWGTGDGPNDIEFRPWTGGTSGLHYFGRDDGQAAYTINPRTPSIWRHFTTIGVTSTTQFNLVYEDGVQVESVQQGGGADENPSNTGGLRVAGNAGGGAFLGYIDELRIATSSRDASWVEAEYSNQFTPTDFYATSSVEAYTPATTTDEATHNISSGGSSFFDITFADATTSPAFTEPSVVVSGDFTVATGTVALPTSKLNVGGSFINNGVFMHNNNEVEFDGSGSEVITLNGTEFLNQFYDVTFSGSGDWTFTDANATTTNLFAIEDGTVTFPSGALAIGNTLDVSGSGDFTANGGTVVFTSASSVDVTTNNAAFNNVIFGSGVLDSWYAAAWSDRVVIDIASTSVTGAMIDFPVYINLADLGSVFWANVAADGADIRMTSSNGTTELAYELVSIDTNTQTGELHFKAPMLTSGTDNRFYLYYNNVNATAYSPTDTYGRNNVWTNDYLAVYHLGEEVAGTGNIGVYTDSTGNGRDGDDFVDATGTTGFIGQGQEWDEANADYIQIATSTLDGQTDVTVSWWYQTTELNDHAVVSGANSGQFNEVLIRLDNSDEFEWFDEGTVDFVDISLINDGAWRAYHTVRDTDNNIVRFYINAEEDDQSPTLETLDAIDINDGALIIGQDQDSILGGFDGGEELDGFLDELRFSSVVRDAGWITTEYDNQFAPTSFYATSSELFTEAAPVFTLNEANADADGDVTVSGALLIAPSDTFTIGGSALNNSGTYDANNATTTFDSNDLGETIDFGTGIFYNLSFNGVGGGWTLSTTTVENNATLVTGDSFVQAPNTTLSVQNIFRNSFTAASTTWTDSTLVLTGGDYVVTDRLDSGDDYATIEVSGDSDITIWNSTISTSTILDTSSIYMPDFGGNNGELRIFGDYTRTTGAEYWSSATDFDGTDISGSPRQVDVRIASGTSVRLSGSAILNMLGSSTASTTVDAITGTFDLSLSGATLNAQYFTMTGTGVNGFELLDSVSVTNFTNGDFSIASGTTAVTVDASTINAQPSTEYPDLNFASVSGPSVNVTASGTASAFWLFSGGVGDRYGESFDDDDGDPGTIQWDDSNYAISIRGTVYADNGSTTASASVCNGVTQNVTVVLDSGPSYTAACDPTDGSFEVTGIVYVGEPKVTAYLNSEATNGAMDIFLLDELTGSGVGTGAGVTTVTRPTTIEDNSVLVAIIGKNDDPGITPPAGWTLINEFGDAANDDIYTGIWYRVVSDASSEPTSYDFNALNNNQGYSYWIGSFLNVDTTTPIDVSSGWTELLDDGTPETPSVVTTVNNTYVLSSWFVDNDVAVQVASDEGWDTRAYNIVGTNNVNLSVISRQFATPSTTQSIEMVGVPGTRDPHVGTFALQPAATPPTATTSVSAAVVTQTPLGTPTDPVYEDIAVRDSSFDQQQFATGATVVLTTPSVVTNDVLVVIIGKDDDPTVSAPAGWTEIATRGENAEADVFGGAWYRVVTDATTEPATHTFTNNDGTDEIAYWIGSLSGVDVTSPLDVATTWDYQLNDNSPAAESITTVTDKAQVFAAWMVIGDTNVDMPLDWETLVEDSLSPAGNTDRLFAVSTKLQEEFGATGDAEITSLGNQDSMTIQFAMRPQEQAVPSRIEGFDIYANQVIVRHEDIAALTIADMTRFDNDNDSDIPFTASTSTSPDLLTVLPGSGLYVWDSKQFIPGGEINLSGYGTTEQDGTLSIGNGGTLTMAGTDPVTIGGGFYGENGAVFSGASSTVTFTATNTGQTIDSRASSTFTFYDIDFTGVGGGWAVQTPIISQTGINLATGTVSGVSDVTVESGSFSGNGLVNMTGGTVAIERNNTLGGTQGWTFNNLTLGNVTDSDSTTMASDATTTVRSVLTISTNHLLDGGEATFDLTGSGNVFATNGTFQQGTSTVRYSGATPNIDRTPYYNLRIDTDAGGDVVATGPSTNLQVFNSLTVGNQGTSTLDLNTNDPALAVAELIYIGQLGTIEASDTATLEAFGSWDNDGVFAANGGTVRFGEVVSNEAIAAGSSPFADLTIDGLGTFTMTEHATVTGDMVLGAGNFTMSGGQVLSVGNTFTNSMLGGATNWTGSTLRLYGDQAYDVNAKTTSQTYGAIVTASSTQPRFWNATSTSITTNDASSVYSRNHAGVDGALNIYGEYRNSGFDDYWSYNEDFDGAALGGGARQAAVLVEAGGSVLYTGGSLTVLGSSTATTSIDALTVGTYDFRLGGSTDVNMNYYQFRDTTADGLTFSGSPDVTDLSHGDFEIAIAGGSGMTVGGSVISANPAPNYTNIRFATTTAISAFNVTATGSAASSWRFVNVPGNLAGEDFDNDPGDDPGLLVWEDSAAIINIEGTVYSDDGVTESGIGICDGATANIFLSMDGLTFASTSCAIGSADYTFSGISYGLSDVITVYIGNGAGSGVVVSQDPLSSIGNMDIYENRVIVRHESGDPLTIDDMDTWDSDDDADIPFTATGGSPDTLVLPSNHKLVVWESKTFAPDGDVTVSGGGAGADFDGTVELLSNATFQMAAGEEHSIGGSLITAAGAVFDASTATTTFTTTGAARTININDDDFYNLVFNGTGSWTVTDTTLTTGSNFLIQNGAVTLPSGTTTIGASFVNSGGSFDSNGGRIVFDATSSGNTVTFGGSDTRSVLFAGTGGGWTMADTNATTTDYFRVATGSVTLPSGVLAVGADFIVNDTITNNSGTVRLATSSGAYTVTLSGNDLNNLFIDNFGSYTFSDVSASLLGDLDITTGASLAIGDGTFSIGGSLAATGTLATASSSILFNSGDTGELIYPGNNVFYDVVFGGALGGWTVGANATVTNNLSLSAATTYIQSSGTTLYVGGVFTNNIGAATTWLGSTLVLDSGSIYETNSKSTPAELYDTVILGENTDVSTWNASSTNLTVPVTSSLYSQDHANNDGDLAIFGDYNITSGTEYWSYATDFDGAALGGSSRAVDVFIASGATTTLVSGTLEIIGIANSTTTISTPGSGQYSIQVLAGVFNAEYFDFEDLDTNGLQFSGTPTITSLDNGGFTQALNGASLITLASTTLNANAGLIITGSRFTDGGFTGGINVNLDATTTNSWTFTGHTGNLSGEVYDQDGTDACSSIRWDDSDCLLTEQAHYRWRNDDGGEGAPPGTWYDNNWSSRQRIRIDNNDLSTTTNAAVKMVVPYDADMQTDFDDLRFTDSSGVTEIDHWQERFSTGVSADVWVEVPTLGADKVTEIYMYYGNVSASSTSSSSEVFIVVDDFEDNNLDEYGGDKGLFSTNATFAFGGGFGLDTSGFETSRAPDGIFSTTSVVSQGEIIRYMQYVDTTPGAGAENEACAMFGVQTPGLDNDNYGVCLELFGTERISLVKNVESTDTFPNVVLLSSSTVTYTTGWYEVEIDWQTDNTIDVTLFDPSGTEVASTSATDSDYSFGGFGFTYWDFHGGWDSFTSRPRTDNTPIVYFGAEQADGGASWAAAQDTLVGGFETGETARLRVGIENTGLDITDQEFQLEYAAKLTAPSCEAVTSASYAEVPVDLSCGSSPICMTASTTVSNGAATTDHLVTDVGEFVPGEFVRDPSNQTGTLDVDQGEYTEVEYALALTINATDDAYCFRVTNDGAELDSYARSPELTLDFDPIVGTVTFNNGENISLDNIGSTTRVHATATVTDFNGYTDLVAATSTFFRSGVGALCTEDNNNCYISTTSSQCSFTDCSGATCTLDCYADIFFHADPTDDGPFTGQEWFAFFEVEDAGGALGINTSIGVVLETMRALDVTNGIDYGEVGVNANTGADNASTTIVNIGNEAIDIDISGTDMTDGAVSSIPANQQLLATTTFDYDTCGASCTNLNTLGDTIEVDLDKPTTDSPPVEDEVYWGIAVPFGVNSAPYTGVNTFTAVKD